MTEIYLSKLPPSANACYANNKSGLGRGRYKTKRYMIWQNAALWELETQRLNRFFPGFFVCHIIVDVKDWHKRADIDNRKKPLLDLLTAGRIIEDDRFCRDTRIRFADIEGGGVIIRLDDHDGTYETITPQFKFGEAA